MSTVATSHIEIDEHGVAWVAGANVKVIEVALDKIAYGSSPEEIHFQHPHLSLAQIHAALAYYYDHQSELDKEIEKRRIDADALAARTSDTTLKNKLGAAKGAKTKHSPTKGYRRRRGSDTWHWCRNCSTWPTSEFEEEKALTPKAGELCNECLAKERSGNCHP